MPHEVIYNICFNICLLVVLAFLMTKLDFFQRLLFGEDAEDRRETSGAAVADSGRFSSGDSEDSESDGEPRKKRLRRLGEQLLLGGIFGGFCIISDYIGIQVTGALPNARVIGILSAGFLGGPVSCVVTTVVAAVHRYVIFPERISTAACVLSALLQGVIGSAIGYQKREDRSYSNGFLFVTAFLGEMLHILLILLITRPFSGAVEIVRVVIVPMLFINSVGMVIFFNVFKSIFSTEDLKVASRVALTMRTAEHCTPYLIGGLKKQEDVDTVLRIIMEEYRCQGAALIEGMRYLGRSQAFSGIRLTEDNYPRLLLTMQTYKTTRISRIPMPEDAFYPLYQDHVIMAAPVMPGEGQMLALVALFKKNSYSHQADVEFITGLANHFAMQLKLAQMEAQKEALRKAELATLQSQINPHFLFNSLNTISYFCREKPEKARELLLALSSYFRNSLESIDFMVTLETELEHVRAYTLLEEARFEDRLSVTFEIGTEDLSCCVPNLILQPLVENAIRHGAMKREHGIGTVCVRVSREEKNTIVDIEDNGPGMDYAIIQSLHNGIKVEHQGIGLMNVQQRLISIFGRDHGLQIITGETGTDVRLLIPNREGVRE